jgi:hypothetical protein
MVAFSAVNSFFGEGRGATSGFQAEPLDGPLTPWFAAVRLSALYAASLCFPFLLDRTGAPWREIIADSEAVIGKGTTPVPFSVSEAVIGKGTTRVAFSGHFVFCESRA